ncbi:MAG: helix-turn-helix transcriptional regulator [Candidatus Cloacimonadales bacterium]
MSKNLENTINSLFDSKPTANQKAWKIINQFYHLVLTKMEQDNITRADLARKLGKSRASISQMFNKTPNISIKKMIEISDAVDLEINLTTNLFLQENKLKKIQKFIIIPVDKFDEDSIPQDSKTVKIKTKSIYTNKENCLGC